LQRGIGSYPAGIEIEIREGFCEPAGKLLRLVDRPDWQRISFRRKGEIVDELVRVCEEFRASDVEAWRRTEGGPPRYVIGYWHPEPRRRRTAGQGTSVSRGRRR
jgi:hypothetical protein